MALSSVGVDEWLLTVVQLRYEDAITVERVNSRDSRAFEGRCSSGISG